MKLSIFSRLIIGYLSVFLVIGAMSLYAFIRLNQANASATRAVIQDEQLLDQRKKLADLIIMQMGFEKKFAITEDQSFRDHSNAAKKDFSEALQEALANSRLTSVQSQHLTKVARLFSSYESLLAAEETTQSSMKRDHGNNTRNHQKDSFLKEDLLKEGLVDEILNEMKSLETATHQDIRSNLEGMAYAGEAAKKLNIIIWSIALCFMVGTAFVTIRGVTKPMLVLVAKTRDVAKGIFTSDLKIESPPEVASLARSFNAMCDRLNVAEKMKTSFLSVMSHELRTPLTSIKEGVGLLRDGAGGPTTERQNRLLEILSQETTRMIGLVSSLLDLTKMQQGMMPYYLTDESLSLLAESVITEMTPIAEARKIAIRTEFPHTLPMLRLDRERMLQALRNLMGNALKFTPEGGAVSISINRTDRGIQLSITDTGPGIPHESLDTIFEEYRQLPGRYPEGAQGSGLGLAIVKEIITAHGGRVWAESAPGPLNSAGSGTTLSFVLPL